MNTENIYFNNSDRYQTPVATSLDVRAEGLLCMSFGVEKENFDDIIQL
jgi:hypothetical protein